MTFYEEDLPIYAQWILNHLPKKDREHLEKMKQQYNRLEPTEEMWVSLYAMFVEKRKTHLAKAVADEKCKAKMIPGINRRCHREWIGKVMYELDQAT